MRWFVSFVTGMCLPLVFVLRAGDRASPELVQVCEAELASMRSMRFVIVSA